MSTKLRHIRAEFLSLLASGQIVEVGQAGADELYPSALAKQIGPMVADLRRCGLIAHAGATYASRRSRNKTSNWLWQAIDADACRQLAEADLAWLAEHQDDGLTASGPRQLFLFEQSPSAVSPAA